jgi:nucleoside-diphosphate-sugar epimerase
MSVLITGGTGFIGLHTSRVFLEQGFEVVSTQFRVRRELAEVEQHRASRFHREVVDVTSGYALDELFERHRIEHVLHLAVPGLGALPAAEDYRSNMMGALAILDAARRHRVRRVVVASSITAYHGLDGPFLETMPMPIASNGATSAFKKAGEITGLHFADRTGLDVVFARISFVYGPLYHSFTNAPSRIAHSAVHGVPDAGKTKPLAGDHFDYLYVGDCADALFHLQTATTLTERIYNVGGGTSVPLPAVLTAAQAVIPSAEFTFADGQDSFHKPASYLDIERLARDTGFRPKHDINSGMAAYIAWLREHEV